MRATKNLAWILLSLAVKSVVAKERQVMVVTGTDDKFDDSPRVLEIFDFEQKEWRAIEKSKDPIPPGPTYRAESIKPGSARLIEDHSVLQYELKNGLALELASYPKAIEGSATLEYGDTFCLVGGYDTSNRVLRDAVLCWNPLTPRQNGSQSEPATGGWVALPNMNTPRHMPGAVVMDGKLYVVGGYDTNEHKFLSSMEVFDDVSQRWYTMAPMMKPRAGLQLVALKGRIYAIGGWHNYKYLNTVEEYDPLRDQWREVASLKKARAKFGAVTHDGKIFVVGGKKGFKKRDQLRSMEVFDPATNTWQELETALSIISGPTRATVVHDLL